MTLFDIFVVLYAVIGAIVFLFFLVAGWETGDAGAFIMLSFAGGILGIMWLPAAIFMGSIFAVLSGIQWLMDTMAGR